MTARCGWCYHPDREEWERRLAGGDSVRDVAQSTPYSVAAAYRHIRAHIRAELLVSMRTNAQLHLSDFADRLCALAEETATVRDYAKKVNDPKLLLSALREERDVLSILLGRLGIDDSETVAVLREAQELAKAVGSVLLGSDPSIARALSERLADRGQGELAKGFSSIAERAAARQLEASTSKEISA